METQFNMKIAIYKSGVHVTGDGSKADRDQLEKVVEQLAKRFPGRLPRLHTGTLTRLDPKTFILVLHGVGTVCRLSVGECNCGELDVKVEFLVPDGEHRVRDCPSVSVCDQDLLAPLELVA